MHQNLGAARRLIDRVGVRLRRRRKTVSGLGSLRGLGSLQGCGFGRLTSTQNDYAPHSNPEAPTYSGL